MTALLLAALLGAAPAEPSAPPEVNPLHRAATALRAKDFEGARRLYESVLETDPRSWDALFGRARALAFSGSYAEGVKAFTEMLAIHPRDPDALLARGRVYAWLGNFYAAQLDLEAVTSAYPSYVDAWSALGDIFLWSGRPKDALAIYDRWVVVRPESADAYLARARARR